MKILITGSSGLVGSACVQLFKEKGWEVFGIDNNMRSKLFGTEPQDVEHDIDICDKEAIDRVFEENKFDAIVHAAAQPSHDWAKKDPLTDFGINAFGTLVLLEATRKYSPDAVFVYVSTDKVYGENMRVGSALQEDDTRYFVDFPHTYAQGFREDLGLDFAGQRSLFGCSKTAADIYVQEYGNYFGMKTACFRPGCITGKNHQGAEFHGFLAYLVKCVKTETPYTIFGFKGKQVRDQIHAYDLANAFYHFIQEPKVAAVYNIGGGPERSVSVLEAMKISEEKTGMKAKVEFGEARKGDRIWDVHNVSKFKKDYPEWDYLYSLDDIMTELCV